MKKTILSVASLLLVSGVLTSAALAAFIPTGKFSGMEFRTSNLSLVVDPDYFGPGNFRAEHFLPGAFGIYPGMEPFTDDFAVRNESDQGQNLQVTGKIIPGNQDWEAIKNLITLSIFSHENGQSTPVYTLAQWSEQERELPFPRLMANTMYGYQMRYSMLATYPEDPDGEGPLQAGSPIGSEMMNKVSQNAVFVLTGTPTNSL